MTEADIAAWLDGTDDPLQAARLERELAADPAAAAAFVAAVRFHHDLFLVAGRPAARSVPRLVLPRRPWWLGWPAALAACLLLALGLAWSQYPGARPVAIATASGGWIERGGTRRDLPAGQGMTLRSGDRLVAAATDVELRFPDGSEVVFAQGATASLDQDGGVAAKRITLERGGLHAVVAKQPLDRPMRFATAQAEAVVRGTRLSLDVADGATRLAVSEGVVDLQRGGELVSVRAGDSAVARAGQPLAALPAPPAYYGGWKRGIPTDPGFFPIGVWQQNPAKARAYREAGINLYVSLPDPATGPVITDLAAAGMRVICVQDAGGLSQRDSPTIVGWMNLGPIDGVPPASRPRPEAQQIQRRSDEMRTGDPSRPVVLYVLPDPDIGWGSLQRAPRSDDDFQRCLQAGDILGLEAFPVNTAAPDGLAFLARSVDRLRLQSGGKPVWSWIECTRIHADGPPGPTPARMQAEVWLAIIHGASGICYFCHAWTPECDDIALLHDPAMLAAVTAVNHRITALAPVLNGLTVPDGVRAVPDDPAGRIDTLVKRQDGSDWIFAISLGNRPTVAGFTVPPGSAIEVVGEDRRLTEAGGRFSDAFDPDAVHVYRVTPTDTGPPP